MITALSPAATLRVAALVSLSLLASCDRREIQSYSVPKEPSTASPAGPQAPPTQAPRALAVQWTLPEGWKEIPTDEPMRLATIQAGEDQILISAFPGDVGGTVANVNRWRGQLGLPQATEAEILPTLKTETIGGTTVSNLRIVSGTGTDMLAAIIAPGDGKTWFAKCTTSADNASKLQDQFAAFSKTFRLAEGATPTPTPQPAPAGGLPSDHPPIGKPAVPADHPPISGAESLPDRPRPNTESGVLNRSVVWKSPADWQAAPDPSGIAVSAFDLMGTGGAGRVTLTSLLGDGGGPLSNINRWRGQLGLPPVAALTDQPTTDLGNGAILVHLRDATGARAMSAAIVPEGPQTWFFKLSGDAPVTDPAKPEFERFVREVGTAGVPK